MNNFTNIKKQYLLKDKKSFEKLYWSNWERLCVICNSKINDLETSEEIVQDVFISIWKRRNELYIKTSIENYLIKAVKLKVIDFYRRKNAVSFKKNYYYEY